MEIARLIIGAVLLVVAAALAVQLWNGRWLFLIAKPDKTKKGTFYPEGTMKTGQRAAWVMVTCFAVVATLMAYEMGVMTGVPVCWGMSSTSSTGSDAESCDVVCRAGAAWAPLRRT